MVNRQKSTAILLLSCPDQKGILASITDFINQNGGNIIYLDQHVDIPEKAFFMRVEWELEEFCISKEKIEEVFDAEFSAKYKMVCSIYFSENASRMAVFVSKMSHCLYDMLARYKNCEWSVEIPLVVSNHPDLEEVAKRFNIDYHCFPITKENKEDQEGKILKLLESYRVDFIVLARYMQILTNKVISRYPNRIINIHHSFLPAFVGAKPYHAAHERGVKLIGATSHYVTDELDAGPIIGQDIAHISHKNDVSRLIEKGRDLEKIVLSDAVQKHITRKILTFKNKTIIFE